jgi:hypothetical protein
VSFSNLEIRNAELTLSVLYPLTTAYGGASPKGEAFYILAKIQLL